MRPRPETRYARIGDDYIAYQTFGEGSTDVVLNTGWYSHVEQQWEFSPVARFVDRLGSFARVIAFDRRGHGMSDPGDPANATLEEWMNDVRAVMDAAPSERAVLVCAHEAGPVGVLYAATHPSRVSGLVLLSTWASLRRRDDFSLGMPDHTLEAVVDNIREVVVNADPDKERLILRGFAEELIDDEAGKEALRRYLRQCAAPGTILRLLRGTFDTDVRHVLPSVRVPTLVVQRRGDTWARLGQAQYIADHIDGARLVELPGTDHLVYFGDWEAILDEVEEFVTGSRPHHPPNRVLATVLFTDIVDSTSRAAAAGDRRWRELLDAHHRTVRRELERHQGREVQTVGDGFLATFDGPARAVRCASAIVDGVRLIGVDVRAGLHTGEIELNGSDVAGIAVHIGRRVSDLAAAAEVLVSRTVVDLVAGSGLGFSPRGTHTLKGVPGEWQLFAVER